MKEASAAPPETLAKRRDRRLRRAFAREREAGLRLAVKVRVATFAAIALWLLVSIRDVAVVYYLALCLVFVALGVLQLVAWPAKLWPKYVFAVVDAVLLAAVVAVPNPFLPEPVPQAVMIRGAYVLYFFLFLAHTVLSLSPLFVLWTGFVCAAAWSAAVAWIVAQPGTRTIGFFDAGTPIAERIGAYLEPNTVALGEHYQQIVILLLVAGVLAVAVMRSQRLVREQAALERERGNLARYFSPNVVDELAAFENPLGGERRQHAAVLFADIIGFTALAERSSPEAVIALLREHYDRLGAVVFAHGGTLDKYVGDCLMATFGTPRPGVDDATRALACAKAMLAGLAAWNGQRAAAGQPPLRVGIGLDYGEVVLGNIGSERRLEFTVIGDTVNVASRLEGLTRELGADLVASDDLVEAVRREGGEAALAGLEEGAAVALRGRREPVRVWTLGGNPARAVA